MTGLPATGKSVIADVVAGALSAPVFSVDPLEAALLRLGITREQHSDATRTTSRTRLPQANSVSVKAQSSMP
jgi:predicted kinase